MTRTTQRGMTLVELLVAMTIGLAVTLVVTTLLVASENHKRTTTSTNDADQTGNYAFYALDRAVRDAGSAIAQSAITYPTDSGVLGCELNVAGFLPRTTALPTPFAAFLGGAPNGLRVAPLLIAQGQSDGGSDVLVVLGGSGSAGGVSRAITAAGDATQLILDNTIGFVANDIALVSQPGVNDCLLEQVSSASGSTLSLNTSGVYYTSTGTSTPLTTLASSLAAYVTPLGNAQANNVQYQLFGVGTDNVLYSYDLLQNQAQVQGGVTDSSQAVADQVVSLTAIYGVQATPNSGVLDHWVAPTTAYGYDITTVMGSEAKMELIIAVRIALVVRGEYYDKNLANVDGLPTQVTIFNGYTDAPNGTGNSLSQNISLINAATGVPNYRYRVFEFTVPLRNMVILAKG